MRVPPTVAGLSALTVAGLALGLWTWGEARRQRGEIVAALTGEAALLAASLAPGLAAASDALREIDEAIAEHLLDEARLLAELARDADPDPERLRRIAEDNGLDTIAILEPDGRTRLQVGEPPGAEAGARLDGLLAGRFEEQILAWDLSHEARHLAGAARLDRGGAVLVRVHADTAYAYSRRLGIENLLRRLVSSDGVLYLEYAESPGGDPVAVAWDGGQPPAPAANAGELRELRGRLAFEVQVPVESPAGRTAALRVGLDGDAVARASHASARRGALVGVALAAFGLVTAAYALVSRQRDRERVAAARHFADLEEARRQSERLALAGTLAAGLAHEVRNPLNSIGLAAQTLERGHADPATRQAARLIRAEVTHLDGVLRGFLDLARPGSGRRERVALDELGREVLDLLAPETAAQGLVAPTLVGTASVCADREALRRALINLVRNAIQVSPPLGQVQVEIGLDGAREAVLRVLDEGPGLAPEMLERALEPFVSTRAGGTGLGLALARRVAEEHGGSLRLGNRVPRGAVATLRIPVDPVPPPVASD